MGLGSIGMITYSIEFTADFEMTGTHAHPPVLTTRIRPNLVVADNYCLCFITETTPSEGGQYGGRGSFKAMGVCTADVADRFAPAANSSCGTDHTSSPTASFAPSIPASKIRRARLIDPPTFSALSRGRIRRRRFTLSSFVPGAELPPDLKPQRMPANLRAGRSKSACPVKNPLQILQCL